MNNKKNITKKFLIKILTKILIISLFSISLYSQTANDNFKELYSKMKEKYSSIYPKTFEAYIEGKIIERQISTIPTKNYTSSKDKIKLKFAFTQGAKPTIILENVDSFYKNMFEIFEGVLETTGFYAIVGNSQNFNSFLSKFIFESLKEESEKYKISLRAKGDNKDYSITYTIDKENLLIEKAEYYNKKSKIYDVDIFYTNVEKYTLPEIIKYKSLDGAINSEIKFVNIKTSSK
ncbi:hypothetical protein [Brachyspira aalborgi]|uniref:Outer membrane lipoprotein carrier protein LolA n=1 Tax=Brachyspira aalborgi TaxID=29522 RepID=A0A5C8EBP8_9SPIR|nr:hypothetical protein [Brachyspira aalborgi]TXJ35487.1 hypothetical protein EPJ78_11305 [Brachyspira aalborgi]